MDSHELNGFVQRDPQDYVFMFRGVFDRLRHPCVSIVNVVRVSLVAACLTACVRPLNKYKPHVLGEVERQVR